jgi:hypothetical protein
MFKINLHAKFDLPGSNILLVTANKPIANETFRTATVLSPYILPKPNPRINVAVCLLSYVISDPKFGAAPASRARWHSSSLFTLLRTCSVRQSAETQSILAGLFSLSRWTPGEHLDSATTASFQTLSRSPRFCLDCFLPNPLQFTWILPRLLPSKPSPVHLDSASTASFQTLSRSPGFCHDCFLPNPL